MSNPFNFPYTPYPVQLELMTAIHECLESGSVGCFESPTGTGKSLSAICSSLHWLVQEEQRIINSKPVESLSSADSDDWLASFTTDSDSQQKEKDNKLWGEAKSEYETMKKRVATSKNISHSSSSLASNTPHVNHGVESDEFLLLSDEKQEEPELDDDDDNDAQHYGDVLKLPQIYYCSRTHSQLAQFIAEVRKTVHKNIRCVTLGSRKNLCVNEEVRKLKTESGISERCLELQKEKGSTLSQSKNKDADSTTKVRKVVSGQGCSFRNKQNESRLADYGLREVIDLEDLMAVASGNNSSLGNRTTKLPPACPYYASRKAMKHAQLICLPYNLLLHSELRKSVGLAIENKVIIVDEAHNLVESINQMYSADVSPPDLDTVIRAIGAYVRRYQTQLSSTNVQNLNVLLSCVRKMRQNSGRVLQDRSTVTASIVSTEESVVPSTALAVNDYLFSISADNTNLTKLTHFITASSLTEKISGFYSKKLAETVTTDVSGGSVIASFRSVIRLLQCLSNQDSDGKVILKQWAADKTNHLAQGVSVSYILLNPSTCFTPLVQQARSVILLGGTLQPFSHVLSNLFPWSVVGSSSDVGVVTSAQGVLIRPCRLPSGDPKIVRLFSCGHVVKPSHVKVLVVTKGGSGLPLQFTADQRMSVNSMNDLLEVLCGLASVVPGGMVVFFTSYAYLEAVVARWKGNNGLLLSRLTQLKPLFVERSPRASVDQKQDKSGSSGNSVWEDYCRQIKLSAHGGSSSSNSSVAGAILFSVIGGSLSEGINFSDSLARCVVVVGMPYPDQRDIVMQQKMQYANKQQQTSDAGSRLLDTMCMKAVNQSIGRSIRHANDYASIVLLDRRYGEERVSAQLPGWIRNSVEIRRDSFKASKCSVEDNEGLSEGLAQFYAERAGK